MSNSIELTVGELRDAMHTVIPKVPDFIARPESGGPSPLEERPTVIREALINAIEADGTKIEFPADKRTEYALTKLDAYTMLGSCALGMYPYMIEERDGKPHFTDKIEQIEGLGMPYDLRFSLKPMFNYAYSLYIDDNPEVEAILQPRFTAVQKDFNRLRGASIATTFRPLLDGGATGATIEEVIGLARRVEQHIPGYAHPTAETLDEHIERRFALVEHLAYLGVSKASINIGMFLLGKPLDELRGELQTTTRNGTTMTTFKRASRSEMRSVFPPSMPDWERGPMEGPTLKCPFHQVDPHEVIDEEEIIEPPEPKNGGKNTVMTELVDATLTYIHERPERFLMSSAERFLKQFGNQTFNTESQ